MTVPAELSPLPHSPPRNRQVCAAHIMAGLSQDVCSEKYAKLLLERTAV